MGWTYVVPNYWAFSPQKQVESRTFNDQFLRLNLDDSFLGWLGKKKFHAQFFEALSKRGVDTACEAAFSQDLSCIASE